MEREKNYNILYTIHNNSYLPCINAIKFSIIKIII